MKTVRNAWMLGVVPAAATLTLGTQPVSAAPAHGAAGKKTVSLDAALKVGCTGDTLIKIPGDRVSDYFELWYTRLGSTQHRTCIGTVKAKQGWLQGYTSCCPFPHHVSKTWRVRIWTTTGTLLDHYSSTATVSTRSHGFHKSYATSGIKLTVCSAWRSYATQAWNPGSCINNIP